MTIQEKLAILREKMKENNMDIYMIPTADFHSQNMLVNISKHVLI